METYLLKSDNGFQLGFAIDNAYIGIKKIAKLLATVDNVSNIRLRRIFNFHNDKLIEFDYLGDTFIVMEPYGDNSKYWIGPKKVPHGDIDVSIIELVFKRYEPPAMIRLIGDIISLNFRRLRKSNEPQGK